jgi:hypothetical protein
MFLLLKLLYRETSAVAVHLSIQMDKQVMVVVLRRNREEGYANLPLGTDLGIWADI